MKKNKIIIVILIITLILGSSYIVYNSLNKREELNNKINEIGNNVSNKDDNNVTNENENTTIKEYTEEEINNILEHQDEILYKNKNLNDLTNKERSYIAFKLYRENNSSLPNEFSVNDIKSYYNKSIYKNIELSYEDIYVSSRCDSLLYKLNNGIYTNSYEGECGRIFPIYRKLVSMKKEENKYTIEYQYIFYSTVDGPSDYYLYYTPDSYYKNENSFKTIKLKNYLLSTETYQYDYDKMKQDTKKYIDDNYDEIKTHLTTYVYTLESTKDGLVLTDFITK